MRARGFTLVEVMVALAIVALALPALLLSLARQSDDTAYLRDKTMAQMIAANKLAEMRLVIASTRTLQAGKDNGVASMGERDWYWWVETTATPVARFFQVDIRVSAEEEGQDQPLYTLSAFMNSDLAVDNDPLEDDQTTNDPPNDPDLNSTPPTEQLQVRPGGNG